VTGGPTDGGESPLARAVAEAAGVACAEPLRPASGGDVNDAFTVRLGDGRTAFVKTRAGAPAGMYRAEAAGLDWLREPGALKTPEVLGFRDPEDDDDPGDPLPRCLVLGWVETGARAPDHDERLGRGLAAIHRAGAERFGLPGASFIGPFPQDNAPEDDWATFYGERRLLPMARRAVDDGRAPASMLDAVEALIPRLPDLVGPPEPPARLHGDLWAGNRLADGEGAPVLIDPAVYGGHREMDLAMMRLFGGFGPRVFAAYEEAAPLPPGADERVGLCQLYPLLVHAALFGGGYAGSAERTARGYG